MSSLAGFGAGAGAAGRRRVGAGAVIIGLLRAWRLPLIMLLSCCAAMAHAQPVFPALTGRVVDGARMLDADTTARIDRVLAALEAATSNQLVVVTVPSLGGMSIEDFGYQLGRKWGIGQRDKDNGVLLIVSRDDRKLRIEVGYGLEGRLTDAQSSEIINQTIVPAFRRGDPAGGIERGVAAISQALAAPPAPVIDAPVLHMPRVDLPMDAPMFSDVESVDASVGPPVWRLFAFTAVVLGGFVLLVVRLCRGRPFGRTPDRPAGLILAAATGAAAGKAQRGKNGNRRSSSSSSRASSDSGSGSSRSSSSSSSSSSSRGGGGSFGGGGASGGW